MSHLFGFDGDGTGDAVVLVALDGGQAHGALLKPVLRRPLDEAGVDGHEVGVSVGQQHHDGALAVGRGVADNRLRQGKDNVRIESSAEQDGARRGVGARLRQADPLLLGRCTVIDQLETQTPRCRNRKGRPMMR